MSQMHQLMLEIEDIGYILLSYHDIRAIGVQHLKRV